MAYPRFNLIIITSPRLNRDRSQKLLSKFQNELHIRIRGTLFESNLSSTIIGPLRA